MSRRTRLFWGAAAVTLGGFALHTSQAQVTNAPLPDTTPAVTVTDDGASKPTGTSGIGGLPTTRSVNEEAKPVGNDPYAFTSQQQQSMRQQAWQAQPALRGMQPEQAHARFRTARNLWATNPRLSAEERQQRLEALARAFWGPDAEVPPETEQDRQEQARLSALQASLQQEIAQLRDQPRSDEDTRSKLTHLLNTFISQTKTPNP